MDGRTLFDPPTDDEGDASDENGEDDVAPTIAPRRFFDAESEESDADAVEDHLRAMGLHRITGRSGLGAVRRNRHVQTSRIDVSWRTDRGSESVSLIARRVSISAVSRGIR